MKLILMCGPQGGGKSTYSYELEKNGIVRISQDDMGKQGHLTEFKAALDLKRPIVIDRINHTREQRNRYIEPARKAGYEIEIVVFHVPRQICFDRMMKRENHPTINGIMDCPVPGNEAALTEFKETIPEEKARQANSALDTFFTKYERVEDSEADKVTRLGWNQPMKQQAIICDLDGTLCNIEHRLHHVKHEIKKNNRWDKFNKEIPNDSLNEWCFEILNKFSAEDYYHNISHKIILCSGRVDSSRRDTTDWLSKYMIPYDNLFMRHRSDFRQDYIIKEIIYEFEIKPNYNVLFAVDDRQQVVNLWRKHGIVCLQCAPGDF